MYFLQELYLAFNHIEDVSPVSMLDQLEILDLEGWEITNPDWFICSV